jgi:hypothetical protein
MEGNALAGPWTFPQSQFPMIEAIGLRGESVENNTSMTLARRVLLWLLFFVICLGLGYPVLNRYDPTKLPGTYDVAAYRDMVIHTLPPNVAGTSDPLTRLGQSENYYRVLVPYVAKPFYWLAKGRVGSWDPALVGLLMANALFTATTASLLVAVGRRLGFSSSTALLAATLYLLNFVVSNLNLVGLIDSGEGCFVMAVVWSLLTGRWFLLPLWGIFGALAKETFAPLSTLFAMGWWLAEAHRGHRRSRHFLWVCALFLTSHCMALIAMATVAKGWIWPWEFAAYMRVDAGLLVGLRGCLVNYTFWYVFIWLLPLGILRLRRLPRPWVLASGVAFFGALALGAYNNAAGNTTRALFNVAGPVLSLSVAIFLAGPDSGNELSA